MCIQPSSIRNPVTGDRSLCLPCLQLKTCVTCRNLIFTLVVFIYLYYIEPQCVVANGMGWIFGRRTQKGRLNNVSGRKNQRLSLGQLFTKRADFIKSLFFFAFSPATYQNSEIFLLQCAQKSVIILTIQIQTGPTLVRGEDNWCWLYVGDTIIVVFQSLLVCNNLINEINW